MNNPAIQRREFQTQRWNWIYRTRTKRWTIQQFKEENSKLKDEIDLLNLNQEMNNPIIQRREFQTQRWNWSLKPEPRDEQSSNSKKIITNSKMKLISNTWKKILTIHQIKDENSKLFMKLNLLNLNQEMNNPIIQRREFQSQRINWIS
jgi:ribosomal protein S24E